jgi:hypothetical protein
MAQPHVIDDSGLDDVLEACLEFRSSGVYSAPSITSTPQSWACNSRRCSAVAVGGSHTAGLATTPSDL